MSKLSNSIAQQCSVPVVQWSWLEEFYKTNMWEAAAGRRQGGLSLVESGSRDPGLVSDWSSRGRAVQELSLAHNPVEETALSFAGKTFTVGKRK